MTTIAEVHDAAGVVFAVVRAQTKGPGDAMATLAAVAGMVSMVGDNPVTWDDPEFQRAFRALFEEGRRLMLGARVALTTKERGTS